MADRLNEEFEKMQKNAAQLLKTQNELEQGLGKYREALRDIVRIQEDILHIQKQKAKAEEDLAKFEKNTERRRQVAIANLASADAEKVKRAKKILAQLDAEVQLRKDAVELLGMQVEKQQEGLDILKKSVKESNKLKAAFNSAGKVLKGWGLDKIKDTINISATDVFRMDKEVRNVARSMGIGNSQFEKLSDHLGKSVRSTATMGVGMAELAKMQKGYSEEIGRSVMLSEAGMVAMAGMAEGTGLGTQFAISMAGAMDKFGASVQTSSALIEDTMNMADAMGVNSAKAAESLQKNLKFAQKYKFKDGVKGLAKMTTEALKLRLDLDGIAGLADKVFRPEGAVEMAAKLQTMGGAFAQMADPMQLMFKARNDFAGFAKDIGKATAEFVEYNAEQGTFDIKGGLAADRMREIANMTGISVEKLQEMAEAQAKMNMIGAVAPVNLDDKQMALVESFAEIGKDGEISINVDGSLKNLRSVTTEDIAKLEKEKQSLEERAKQSRTFMEVLDDLKMQFTTLLLPIARGLKEGLGDPLQEMMKDFNKDDGFYTIVKDWASGVADFIAGAKPVVKFLGKVAEFLGPGGILTLWLGKEAFWLARGALLGRGFNMTANAGGGSGSLGSSRGILGKTARNTMRGKGLSGKMGKFGRGMAKGGMAKGGALALGGMAANVGREFMDDPDSDAGKALGVLGSTASYAGTGAMIGSIIPGLGTAAGAVIGGLIGAGMGVYDEYFSDEAHEKQLARRQTNLQDGIIKFHPQDKFMQMNDGAILASTAPNQLHTAAKELSGGGEHKHSFNDMNVNINVKVDGINDEEAKKLFASTEFQQMIHTKMREVAMSVTTGKNSLTSARV